MGKALAHRSQVARSALSCEQHCAGVAKLADALDLGSSSSQGSVGSSPIARTNNLRGVQKVSVAVFVAKVSRRQPQAGRYRAADASP